MNSIQEQLEENSEIQLDEFLIVSYVLRLFDNGIVFPIVLFCILRVSQTFGCAEFGQINAMTIGLPCLAKQKLFLRSLISMKCQTIAVKHWDLGSRSTGNWDLMNYIYCFTLALNILR